MFSSIEPRTTTLTIVPTPSPSVDAKKIPALRSNSLMAKEMYFKPIEAAQPYVIPHKIDPTLYTKEERQQRKIALKRGIEQLQVVSDEEEISKDFSLEPSAKCARVFDALIKKE